jgi:hypothetical protein
MRAGVASVTVLMVLLAGCGSDDRANRPSTRAPSPAPTTTSTQGVGPPIAVPWWSDGVLHVDALSLRTGESRIVAAGGTTLAGRISDSHSHWSLVAHGRLRSLLDSDSPYVVPAVSADGRHVAWVESQRLRRIDRYRSRAAFTVTEYDVARHRRVGSSTLDATVECCDAGGTINILGVDRDGAVVLGQLGGPSWVWRLGRVPVRVRLPEDKPLEGSDQWPGGITFATSEDGSDPGVFATVDAGGGVHPTGRVPQTAGGVWSPTGAAYAFLPDGQTRDRRARVWTPQGTRTLDAPRGAPVLLWESADAVLLVAGGSPAGGRLRLVRCSMRSGACAQAGPPLRHVHLPATRLFG